MSIQIQRRLLVAGGFAFATVAAPAVFALSGPVPAALLGETNCPPGMTENPVSGSCFEGGNDQAPPPVQAPTNQLGEINGIPCTGHNTGECIGLSEEQVPEVHPHSSVSSSP
ncbi:intersectin-EH binding protein Ibp1 [Mycolicibacterium sp. 141076]|uniref:intersectin-EH binding protein Ibp1 n=1 Tax=Mycolicibacterium sp. 141076 TaxID=3090599 RepID=UPI00299F3CC6|nr:intersectin-EH binding protein Ibp1 [Mycolicibacterium sp. 141076]MDX1878704.1 intersectin-EH binding protein Ibp1 [Mycolicibacterium sp. 141076]